MGYKSKFKGSTVDERLRKCLNLVPTIYQSLLDLRENSSLVPGRFYRITDYVTTTSQENTQSAGHQFDVVVLALTNDTLAERAWVCHHEGDTYFQYSHLEAWQIWYCLDNDTSRFKWAVPVSEGGKGVIYRMIDEYNNDLPFDFRGILFYDKNSWRYTFYFWGSDGSDGSDGSFTYCRSNKVVSSKNSLPFVFFDCDAASEYIISNNLIVDSNFIHFSAFTKKVENNVVKNSTNIDLRELENSKVVDCTDCGFDFSEEGEDGSFLNQVVNAFNVWGTADTSHLYGETVATQEVFYRYNPVISKNVAFRLVDLINNQ